MALGHFFISYSTADAQDFAIQLHDALEGGYPKYEAWLDKRDLRPAEDWDTQLDEAIRDCGAMLFIMTPDSVMSNSMCRNEYKRALSYKKSVIPLFYKDSMLPFVLEGRQYIDFTDFDSGVAKLREHLAWVKSPAGELKRMKDELDDMQRQLNRAPDDQHQRINEAMADLTERIERQQFVVDHPEEAAERTKKSIEASLQRARQPENKPKSTTKFINHPPATVPSYFKDRIDETKLIVDFVKNSRHRIFHLIGRAGIGKTAITVRLLKHLEGGKFPDDNGDMTVDGIVYLSQVGARDLKVSNLFADLCRLLPEDAASELDALFREPKTSTDSKIKTLLSHFPPDKRVLVLMDNFEDIVGEDQTISDSELDEALRAVVEAPPHGVKVLITTRVLANKLYLYKTQLQRQHVIGEGLPSPYAEEMLREMDETGSLGLQAASDSTLADIADKVRRFPRALEALVGWLEVDISTTLDDVLAFADNLPENVVEVLVEQAMNRLDASSLQVIQALAIFGRPIDSGAVDTLLRPFNDGIDSSLTLRRLLNWHFVRRDSGAYTLHPVDRAYALNLIPRGEDSDRFEMGTPNFTQIALYNLAAEYFKSQRTPREEWKTIEDLAPQLAEFDMRCNAGDWDTAAHVLRDIDFHYLLLWGYYNLMIDLHQRLQGKISDLRLKSSCIGLLGLGYESIGNYRKSIEYYESALSITREMNDRHNEGVWLGNLGNAHSGLGDVQTAIDYHQQALAIAREIGDKRGEGAWLGNLGIRYAALGDVQTAIDYTEQALKISREIGDKRGEGSDLGNLGSRYAELGDVQTAIDYAQQALVIRREIGDKRGGGIDLGNLGNHYAELGDVQTGIDYTQQALAIAREIGDKSVESILLEYLGHILLDSDDFSAAEQHLNQSIVIADEIGFNQSKHYSRCTLATLKLYQNDLSNAQATITQALTYDRPENNHNAYVLLGIITLRQGDSSNAKRAFTDALNAANDILSKTPEFYNASDAKGLALCGLALVDNDPAKVSEAKAAFAKAREKTENLLGHIKRTQRLFDALAQADTDGLLAGVRAAIAGE